MFSVATVSSFIRLFKSTTSLVSSTSNFKSFFSIFFVLNILIRIKEFSAVRTLGLDNLFKTTSSAFKTELLSINISTFFKLSPLTSNLPLEIHKLKSLMKSDSNIVVSYNFTRLLNTVTFVIKLFSSSKTELSFIKTALGYCGCRISEFFTTKLLSLPQTIG